MNKTREITIRTRNQQTLDISFETKLMSDRSKCIFSFIHFAHNPKNFNQQFKVFILNYKNNIG